MSKQDFEVFETTEHNTRIIKAYTPYNAQIVRQMRDLGARFTSYDNGRKAWFVRADGDKVEQFRTIIQTVVSLRCNTPGEE